MSIEKLREMLHPPSKPLYAATDPQQWLKVERKLNRTLPQDYKAFIGLFGDGFVGAFLKILNPFSPYYGFNLNYCIKSMLPIERQIRDDLLEEERYAVFPEEGGILPIGDTENGDLVYWHTQGISTEWKIIVRASRSPIANRYKMNLTSFLAELLHGSLVDTGDFYNTEVLFDGLIDKDAPFQQQKHGIEDSFSRLWSAFSALSLDGQSMFNKSETTEIFLQEGLILDHPVVQDYLKTWEHEGFIRFLQRDDEYLRVLEPHPNG